ncbi:MAG: PorV/PorQ family protein [Bacteroidota bacterium]
MRILISLFVIVWSGSALFAQSSGFQLLEINPSARGLSISEATTSLHDGSASIYTNPALLVLNPTSSIDLSYTLWIADFSNVFGGYNYTNGKQAFSIAFFTQGDDEFEFRDGPGEPLGTFSTRQLSISAGYAYDFKWFSLGASGHYLFEELSVDRASGYAFNFGAATVLADDRVRLGASVTNLGEMNELRNVATELPTNLRFGASVDVFELTSTKNDDLPILFSVFTDYVSSLDDDLETSGNQDIIDPEDFLNIGIKIRLAEVVEVSTGYRTGDTARPLSFGAAFIDDVIEFNYALVPFNTGFGTVHSIGLQYKF